MDINVKVSLSLSPQLEQHITALFKGIDLRLDALTLLTETMMSKLSDDIDALAQAVAAHETVEAGVVALLNGLTSQLHDVRAQLDAALAANDPAALQDAINQIEGLQAKVAQDTAQLAAAVASVPSPADVPATPDPAPAPNDPVPTPPSDEPTP